MSVDAASPRTIVLIHGFWFAGPHLLPARPGWQEVADHALDWAVSHGR